MEHLSDARVKNITRLRYNTSVDFLGDLTLVIRFLVASSDVADDVALPCHLFIIAIPILFFFFFFFSFILLILANYILLHASLFVTYKPLFENTFSILFS